MPSVIGRPFRSEVLVPRRFSRLVVTNAQLLNLFTTQITLVPGVSGFFYVPRWFHAVKDAGTAYTLNASTSFGIYWTNIAGAAAATVAPAGFLDQTGQLTIFGSGPFTASVVTAINGAPLVVGNNVANMTLGTGNVTIFCIYDIWPMSFAFV
jgi:hypothetical protein